MQGRGIDTRGGFIHGAVLSSSQGRSFTFFLIKLMVVFQIWMRSYAIDFKISEKSYEHIWDTTNSLMFLDKTFYRCDELFMRKALFLVR